MFLLLAIPLALGWVVARYWLRYRDWPTLLSATCGLSVVSLLFSTNFFYRLTSELPKSVHSALALLGVTLLILWWRRDRQVEPLEALSRIQSYCLGALALLVVIYTNAQQFTIPDDDYWIHAPLQGLMRAGNFPPINPFFSDIPMNGHYGRNLSIVTFSYLSGLDVFFSQHFLTSGLQVVTLLLFYGAFSIGSQDDRTAAFLGSFFVFFGINAGGRCGLVDTVQNNNAFVHMYLALLCLLVLTAWRYGKISSAVVGGLVLGSYAIVYETHFGLVFFTILGVTPILWARKVLTKRQALCALSMLLLSLPPAFTQGGPLTDILDRKLAGREHTQAEQLSKGMQNQAQVVKITFPKEELFQILLETGEYQRAAYIYRLNTPLKYLHTPTTERGYAYVWSWDVLKIHFLPLYLVPWTVIVMFRRNNMAGLFMGAFGTIAFLVPALVNFGPIYESEYFRWEFAASLGFTAALGLSLSTLLTRPDGERAFVVSGKDMLFTRTGKRYLLVAFLTLVNSWAAFTFVAERLQASVGWNLHNWLIFPATKEWLEAHKVLRFDRLDFEAANWLKERVSAGDRVLVNFGDENNFSILYESTLTGITGARCVGHALPLEDEKIGTTPFRKSPAAQLFWQTHRVEPLAQLQVDWIFFLADGIVDEKAPEFPGARLVKRFREGTQERLIYEVIEEELPKLALPATEPSGMFETKVGVPNLFMRGGSIYPVTVVAKAPAGTKFQGTVVLSTVRVRDGLISTPSENLQLQVEGTADARGRLKLEVPFVAPYDEGEYTLKVEFLPAEGSAGLNPCAGSILSKFATSLEWVELAEVEFSEPLQGPLPTRTLISPVAHLRLPSELPEPREVLACWAFYSVERREFDLQPAINLRRVKLSETLRDLPAVTPERPGKYRMSLYLSAGQGHLQRVLGGEVEVVRAAP